VAEVRLGVVYVVDVPPLPPVTVAHPVLPLGDCSHWIVVPVLPVSEIVVLLPEQIVANVAVAVPPTLGESIVTKAVVEFVTEHTPLVTNAL
jgi:hypothetical protein